VRANGNANMAFITGFAVWFGLGIVGGLIARALYRANHTGAALAVILGIFGAFIGGMLGTAAYVHHAPLPLRPGGLIGAVAGGFFFPFVYQFMGRNCV
jgi:uncharacterized membrane protein YeaQ/YmgE (transglycosylase-associated protein family)